MSALKSGDLRGHRNNRNHWQIDPEDLSAWADSRDSKPTVSNTVSLQKELQDLRAEAGILTERLAGRDTLIEQLKADLDYARRPFWKKLLDR